METGDGRIEDSGGATRNDGNVIRLPRDWLGPREELVPIGPAARERAARRDADDGLPPPADAFWSEDSAALHDAVQAPSTDPPFGLVAPVAGRQRGPRPPWLHRVGRVPWRWSLVAVAVATISGVAVIATVGGPGPHRVGTQAGSSRSVTHAAVGSTSRIAADGVVADLAKANVVTRLEAHAAAKHAHAATKAHARMSARGGHSTQLRGHATVRHHSAGSSPSAVTPAAGVSAANASRTPVSTPTSPSASAASTGSSEGSQSATAPAGPTGFGSMSGGCAVKCS